MQGIRKTLITLQGIFFKVKKNMVMVSVRAIYCNEKEKIQGFYSPKVTKTFFEKILFFMHVKFSKLQSFALKICIVILNLFILHKKRLNVKLKIERRYYLLEK